MATLSLIGSSLRRDKKIFLLWIFCLSLAVTGLLVVDVFRESLSETLRLQGRKILSSDLAVSARRPLTQEERQKVLKLLPSGVRSSQVTEMLAMLTHREPGQPLPKTRLASVRFVDANYPIAGELKIESTSGVSVAQTKTLELARSAWLSPDLGTLLGLKIGDEVQLGQVTLTVAGWIRKDSTQTFRMGAMAPRIYVHDQQVVASALIQQGSTFSQTLHFQLPTDAATKIKLQIENSIQDPAVQTTVPKDLEQGPFRILSRLLDYLGLTGLVTLCLGWTGILYLGRRWLALERTSIGILKCLGLTRRQVRLLLVSKLLVILALGVILGGVLAWTTAASVFPLVRDSMPSEFSLTWSWANSAVLLLVGPLSGALLLFPSLNALVTEDPLAMTQDREPAKASRIDLVLFTTLTLLLFALLSLVQARSFKVSGVFLGSLLGIVLIVAGSVSFLLKKVGTALLNKWNFGSQWLGPITLAFWTRRLGMATLMITVSAMAGLLSQLVPHLEKTLLSELNAPQAADRPSLFLIDIQDDQMPELQALFAEKGWQISESAPFIRARILSVNGQEFERAHTGSWNTREEEMDARFRNRGVNLTYRKSLAQGDRILTGKPWEVLSSNPEHSEVSVEQSYADRLGLKLGDVLRFDIQGIELTATIANLREVDWNRFEPNFFITFKPGVMDDAPKTWITTIRRHITTSPVEMQSEIAARLPNVTSLNVREVLDNMGEVFGKLSAGLKVASLLCLTLGISVSLIILMFQLASASKDWHALRLLGLNRRELFRLQMTSHLGLSVVGLLLGSLASVGVAYSLARFVLRTSLRIDWWMSLHIFSVAAVLSLLGASWIAYLLNRRDSTAKL